MLETALPRRPLCDSSRRRARSRSVRRVAVLKSTRPRINGIVFAIGFLVGAGGGPAHRVRHRRRVVRGAEEESRNDHVAGRARGRARAARHRRARAISAPCAAGAPARRTADEGHGHAALATQAGRGARHRHRARHRWSEAARPHAHRCGHDLRAPRSEAPKSSASSPCTCSLRRRSSGCRSLSTSCSGRVRPTGSPTRRLWVSEHQQPLTFYPSLVVGAGLTVDALIRLL